MHWHLLSVEETFKTLESSPSGLSKIESTERLVKYGQNILREKKSKPIWLLFFLQFKDVMILILIAAAIISGILGDLKDSIVILVIVVLNAAVGFIQEYRAEKAVAALKKMAASFARVKRENYIGKIPSTELVPGDIVLIEAGDMLPADMRLIDCHGLKIQESSLTGESYSISKSIDLLEEENAPLGDRINMAYKGTMVTYGRGTGLVVATGMQTEIGSIAKMLQEADEQTPLQKRLSDFGKKLSVGILGICLVLFGIGVLRGENTIQMLLTSISLAVAAIPEALPAVITISLALGARKLVRKNSLIKKLPAVETLGSVTYICSDKTGTLTQNQMTVQQIWANSKETLPNFTAEMMMLLCMHSNQDTNRDENGVISGDPTEIALVKYAISREEYDSSWQDNFKRTYELPFDADRKMMTTVHQMNEGLLVVTKGALESILKICQNENETNINSIAQEYASQGQRLLAYSYKLIADLPQNASHGFLECEQHFCGLAGMIDPPRPEAKQAVAECITAGIIPVMITGDHPLTAKAIAEELGIIQQNETDKIITGLELSKLSREEFDKQVPEIKVYARVAPEQKLQIVKTLQKLNQFVAMTGDGVNDAPALKSANIGISMGITGTDVSKEASHMILLDDNFATIVNAIKEGRRIFDNIRKFIKYTMTSNSGEIWTIFFAPLIGMPVPLLPIHILWINLVTDGLPGLALAGERAEKNIMQHPPRHPGESIFSQGLGWHILWVGLLMGVVCLSIQFWAIRTGNENWQTMVFTVLCFSQMGHALAVRSEYFFLFRQGIFSNIPLIGAVIITFGVQMAIVYVPVFQGIFYTQPLTLNELLLCILASTVVFHGVELEKFIRSYRKR